MGILIAVILICAIMIYLLKPGKFSMNQLNMVYGVNFAHRGLHSKDKTVPENSLAAFAAAASAGYGMELDVQLSRDGEVVVFHDDDLQRVANVNARVDEHDYESLREMRLCETSEHIPLLSDALGVVAGRATIIVELKSSKRNNELCEKTLKLLRDYSGPYCVESFDPRIVAWFYKNAPDILRGQLSDRPKSFKNQPFFFRIALGNLLTNVLCRPQFIAYGTSRRPLLVRIAQALGCIKVCWTVREENQRERYEADNDGVIFEFYTPAIKFK